jgi:hypothetical protein
MEPADWKLRAFYQYQIAKIAKLTLEQTHPASRKRLNFMLDEYIDMLLAMPRQSERMKVVETRMLPTLVTQQRRRVGPASEAAARTHDAHRRAGGGRRRDLRLA